MEILQSHTEEVVVKKIPRTERSDSEMDTEDGGEAGTPQSAGKKGHITNVYLTDSDEEAMTKPMITLRSRPGRIAYGRGSQATATCL